MKEILITSSALILVLLLLRRVFRKTLSRRWQYALWALVLVRLLLPVSFLPAADFSVLTATAPVQQAVAQQVERPYYSRPVARLSPEELSEHNISLSQVPTAEEGSAMILMEPPAPGSDISLQQRGYLVRDAETNSVTLYEHMAVGPGEVLSAVWRAGMVLMGAFFLLSNLLFYLRLRKSRRVFEAESTRRVYLVPEGAVPSPCLFGLFSPAIYITPAVADDPVKLRHALTHEETHAKHWDPLWSLLRCVCLTVYWFDPLVWIAASCSKTDCELACDESVLNALGESERIGYGETLLSLIPVRKGPANPMIAATTMTAGKRELKDRITRIAQKPRQLMAAVVAVAVLASIAAACTFTGGTASPTPAPSPSASKAPSEATLRPLTAEELRWFNEEYFNSSGADQTGAGQYPYSSGPNGDVYYNIRNQFANPINLYDRPEDIDLYELFYCDGEAVPDDELSIVWDGSREDIPCGAYKLSVEAVNDILMGYTGLTLDKTSKIGLDDFTYSQEHNAYYWMHGDTNYCGDLQFTVGTREGDIVKLYHNSNYAGNNWYCVTLRQVDITEWQGMGSEYYFVSNQVTAKPAIPTPLPAGEPNLTIPLDSLEPQTAHVIAYLTNYPANDFPGGYENRLDNWNFDGHHVTAYKAADGLVRVALVREDGSFDVFYNMDAEQYGGMFFFHDLFGRDGFYVDHTAGVGNFPQRDYYYFNENGKLTLLLEATTSVRGGAFQLDLDGDGNDELIADKSFFFLGEGALYQADLPALLQKADPALDHWSWTQWNIYGKYLYARGYMEDHREWVRYFYFDGENLLVYKDEKPTTDHLVDGIAKGVPTAVVEKALEFTKGTVEEQPDGTFLDANWRDLMEDYRPTYDDWRVESFDGPYTYTFDDVTVVGWGFNHERHTTTPEKVGLAGGRYIDEDNWVSPGYPGCDYLFFHVEGVEYTFLWHEMNNDMSLDSEGFREHVEQKLLSLDYDIAAATAAQSAGAKLDRIIGRSGGQVILRLAPADGETVAYPVSADEGNGPYYRRSFTDPEQYRWSFDYTSDAPKGTSLTITDPSWEYFIRLWEGSDLVMIKPDNDGATWYRAEPAVPPEENVFSTDIFSYMRRWFDEAELDTLQDNISVPDRGQGPLEIVQEWVEAYEGAYLKLTPGSHLRCTFMKPAGVGTLEDMPEPWFPKEITQYPHFAFCYDTIFVPEGSDGLNWFMAGNTGEYEGPDPEAPQGALTYSRRGSMYLKDGAWYCAGIGTG